MALVPLTQGGPDSGENYEYRWSSGYLQAHFLSDVGKKRTQNEDYCILCAPEDRDLERDRGFLFAVADGMGGVSGGEFASRLALHTVAEHYYQGSEETAPARLRESVNLANRRIYEEAENHPEYQGMGTTVSAVAIKGDHAYIAQVGDSRVYLAREGNGIKQVTDDHSLVAEQVRNGYISEEEARNHSLKNLITRAVGTREGIKVDLFCCHLHAGDNLVICSDGLSNVVSDHEIANASKLESLQGVARILVGHAIEAGGPDNITVAVLRVTSPPPRTRREEGAQSINCNKLGFLGKIRNIFS